LLKTRRFGSWLGVWFYLVMKAEPASEASRVFINFKLTDEGKCPRTRISLITIDIFSAVRTHISKVNMAGVSDEIQTGFPTSFINGAVLTCSVHEDN
jgi:hypothetical protein